MNVLVTGGLGFIGSNLIRMILRERPTWHVVNLDAMTYAANPANLEEVKDLGRYEFVLGDVANQDLVRDVFARGRFDAVIHAAAESHVDRSIESGLDFVRTNVQGTAVLLDAATAARKPRFVQVSTDEVYGTLEHSDMPFTEQTPLKPRSPYSASKAAADLLVFAYAETHKLDAIVTRCSNNYGPYQHPEKFIPLAITSMLEGENVPIYGDGKQRRDWIHVEDHCRGVLCALEHGRSGRAYNFGGDMERENIDVARTIAQHVGADRRLITHVTDRPGHDRRYAVNSQRARQELDWQPKYRFESGIAATVAWYREHREWWAETSVDARRRSKSMIHSWQARNSAASRVPV